MQHHLLIAATLLAASSGKTFHIGPWIIVPILILIAIIGTPIYIIRDRRRRRADQQTR
jgi:Flp pilus assembly protein TadB